MSMNNVCHCYRYVSVEGMSLFHKGIKLCKWWSVTKCKMYGQREKVGVCRKRMTQTQQQLPKHLRCRHLRLHHCHHRHRWRRRHRRRHREVELKKSDISMATFLRTWEHLDKWKREREREREREKKKCQQFLVREYFVDSKKRIPGTYWNEKGDDLSIDRSARIFCFENILMGSISKWQDVQTL